MTKTGKTFEEKLEALFGGDDTACDGTASLAGAEIPYITMPEYSQEVLDAYEFEPGFHRQRVLHTPRDGGKTFISVQYLANDGGYIGDEDRALMLMKRGIVPERISSEHTVCSIGFCEKEQKWYGWSHRAIYGFGVGDVVKEGDCTASSGWTREYLQEHPEADLSLPIGFKAKTLEDAKRMAIAFADSVA